MDEDDIGRRLRVAQICGLQILHGLSAGAHLAQRTGLIPPGEEALLEAMAESREEMARAMREPSAGDVDRLSTALLLIIQQALGMKVNADHGTVIRLTADEINAGKAALEAAGKWPYRSWEKAANG